MSALEQRSLTLGELGLIDATHYIFGVYGFGTITDRDEIVGGQWGGHNGGDNNCGIIVPIAADDPKFDYLVHAAPHAMRARNDPSGYNKDGSGQSHHPYYAPQFDAVRRTLIQVGMAVVSSDPYQTGNAVVSIDIDKRAYEPKGTYPDVPIPVSTDAPTVTDPRDNTKYILAPKQLGRLRGQQWDVITLDESGWDANVGMLCLDTRRDRLITIHSSANPQDFCYRELKSLNQLTRLSMTGPDAWQWGDSKCAAVFSPHPTDRAQDCILLKGPYQPGGVV